MHNWQSSFVIGLLIILAGTTAYFASRSAYLQGQLRLQNATTSQVATTSLAPSASAPTSLSPSSGTTPSATTSNSPSPNPSSVPATTAQTVTVAAADRLSQPSETYTVVQGDTLYAISLKQNISQDKLAQVNSLKDPFLLKLGQVLIIPTVDANKHVYEVDFTADTNRAAADQHDADSGKNIWRLNPATVALAENGGVFGLTANDQYQVATSDTSKGTATVTATQSTSGQASSYTIDLVQPVTKGATGIWAIVRIAPTS